MADENAIKMYIEEDEIIKWCGKPSEKQRLEYIEFILIPVFVVWSSFILKGYVDLIFNDLLPEFSYPTLFMLIIWLPLVYATYFLLLGRFFYKVKKCKNTYYCLTNKRILVLNKLQIDKLQSISISDVKEFSMIQKKDGYGDLIFGEIEWYRNLLQRSGLDVKYLIVPRSWLYGNNSKPSITFTYIKDADEVYKIFSDLKHSK